jgi:hypothetical protein
MEEKVTRGQSTKSETVCKKTIVKNVLLVSKLLYRNTVWIVFQKKYEVFRHLIKDNKYENNKIQLNYKNKYVFSSLHLIYLCLFLSNKNRNFQGKIINLWLL